jgi:hypothetical protein
MRKPSLICNIEQKVVKVGVQRMNVVIEEQNGENTYLQVDISNFIARL